MSCFSYYSCYFWYFHWNIINMKFATQFPSMYTPKNFVWSTCFIFWPAIFTVIFTFRRFLYNYKSSTSCFQISFDYASLSLYQCSANPYVFQILNMCDYFNRCFEQSNNYKYWGTPLVSFFPILIANGVSVTLTTRCTSYFRSGSQLR